MAKKVEKYGELVVLAESVANAIHHALVIAFGEACPMGNTIQWKGQKAYQFILPEAKVVAAIAVCAALDAVFYDVKG